MDTGASGTVVEETRRATFGLTPLGAAVKQGAGAGASDLAVAPAKVDELTLGVFRLRDFRVSLVSLAHVNDVFRQMGIEQVDGVLGADLLDAGRAVIDYENCAVFLKAPNPARPESARSTL